MLMMQNWNETPPEPDPVKKSWRDWDGWLLVTYLAVAVISAGVALGYGHVQ